MATLNIEIPRYSFSNIQIFFCIHCFNPGRIHFDLMIVIIYSRLQRFWNFVSEPGVKAVRWRYIYAVVLVIGNLNLATMIRYTVENSWEWEGDLEMCLSSLLRIIMTYWTGNQTSAQNSSKPQNIISLGTRHVFQPSNSPSTFSSIHFSC